MNILYLCDEYPPGRHGGIGTMVQVTARAMVQQGHNVVVAGFYDWGYGEQDSFYDEGVAVYRFRRGLSSGLLVKQEALAVRAVYKLFKLSGIWQRDIERSLPKYRAFIERIVRENHIDLIEMPDYNDYMRFCNSYVPFPSLPAPVVVKMHGCMTYILRENGQEVPQHIWQMEHDVLQQATALCSVSKYNALKTAEYLNCKKEVRVLYNGIRLPVLQKMERDKSMVIFAGTLHHNKGIYQLAKAWNIVHAQLPAARLRVFGRGHVEKVNALLVASARSTVEFRGHAGREQLFENFAKAQVAVFPSYAETFGLVALEAMMCGAAVIFTKRTAGPELIEDGLTGMLVDPDDVDDIAAKIIGLLTDEKKCHEIALQGQAMATSGFDIELQIKKYINWYEEVINNNRTHH